MYFCHFIIINYNINYYNLINYYKLFCKISFMK